MSTEAWSSLGWSVTAWKGFFKERERDTCAGSVCMGSVWGICVGGVCGVVCVCGVSLWIEFCQVLRLLIKLSSVTNKTAF